MWVQSSVSLCSHFLLILLPLHLHSQINLIKFYLLMLQMVSSFSLWFVFVSEDLFFLFPSKVYSWLYNLNSLLVETLLLRLPWPWGSSPARLWWQPLQSLSVFRIMATSSASPLFRLLQVFTSVSYVWKSSFTNQTHMWHCLKWFSPILIRSLQAALPQGIVPFVFAKEYNVHPAILNTA